MLLLFESHMYARASAAIQQLRPALGPLYCRSAQLTLESTISRSLKFSPRIGQGVWCESMQRESGKGSISPDIKDRARVKVLQACADALMPAMPVRAAVEKNPAVSASFLISGAVGNMDMVLDLARTRLTPESRMDFFM